MVKTIDEVNWGIIGCGDVTEVKSGPAIQNISHSNLLAVMRRNCNLAADYAKRHNVESWYCNADDLINREDINTIYIATPPSSHLEYTIKSAEAGKNVYVEKPMALNYNQCKKMIAICKANNVKLFVAYYRRALPKFLKVKELIDQNKIGDIRSISGRFFQKSSERDYDDSNWRINPNIAGGGYFYDLASHTIDILQYLLGKVTDSSGFASNLSNIYKAEDSVCLNMKFEKGYLFSGVWNFSSATDIDEIIIYGNNGEIKFSTFSSLPIFLTHGSERTEFLIKNPLHIQTPLIQTVVDDLRGNFHCPSTGESGSLTNKIFDTIIY